MRADAGIAPTTEVICAAQRLEGFGWVITGASSGLGRETAFEQAQRGTTVIVAARREQVPREVAEECERLGARALAIPTDVTDEEAVRRLAARVIENFGRIDLWVTHAAVMLLDELKKLLPTHCGA